MLSLSPSTFHLRSRKFSLRMALSLAKPRVSQLESRNDQSAQKIKLRILFKGKDDVDYEITTTFHAFIFLLVNTGIAQT